MTTLYSKSTHGTYGRFAIEIKVDATTLPDLQLKPIQNAAYEAARQIESEVMAAIVAQNPDAQLRSENDRTELLALFPGNIYVEEIPNGYCSDWCCRHLPWFVVTTSVGRIKIGCRKRVIQIDWSDTRDTKTAEELFPGEDVTKGGKMIHAWSLERAGGYIQRIIALAGKPEPN